MVMHLTKIDAATRQIETAIDLYFHDGDPVSVHTLTMAALEIVRILAGKKHRVLNIRRFLNQLVKPEFHEEVARKMSEPENFFKHASRDKNGTIDFDPRQTEWWLLDAVFACRALEIETPRMELFRVWAYATFARRAVTLPSPDLTDPFCDAIANRSRLEHYKTDLPMLLDEAAKGRKSVGV
jgi:hypothetical protein